MKAANNIGNSQRKGVQLWMAASYFAVTFFVPRHDALNKRISVLAMTRHEEKANQDKKQYLVRTMALCLVRSIPTDFTCKKKTGRACLNKITKVEEQVV